VEKRRPAAPWARARRSGSRFQKRPPRSTKVRDEVAVGKKPVREVKDISGEVRHEELVVDVRTKRAG
jgi:hypothetical protein